jgi:hypothetical protein
MTNNCLNTLLDTESGTCNFSLMVCSPCPKSWMQTVSKYTIKIHDWVTYVWILYFCITYDTFTLEEDSSTSNMPAKNSVVLCTWGIFTPLAPIWLPGHLTALAYKTKGTNSVPMIRISAEQPIWHETISIWHCGGSNGNSAICRPSGVRVPVWSRAPRIHSWYREFKILSWKLNQI